MNSNNATLIAGDSFIFALSPAESPDIDSNKYVISGSPGAGNQSIAAAVLHECSKTSYKKVIVVWSGIKRLDFPIGKRLHDTFPKDKNGKNLYPYYKQLDDVVWYHSGGFGMSGMSNTCPAILRDWFDKQYLSSDDNYLTTLSLQSIVQTQSFLQANHIPFKMSFIYDVDADYSDTSINRSCGQIVRSNCLNTLIDWNNFASVTPYEYSKNLNQISQDGFHPETKSLINWFNTYMDINLLD